MYAQIQIRRHISTRLYTRTQVRDLQLVSQHKCIEIEIIYIAFNNIALTQKEVITTIIYI